MYTNPGKNKKLFLFGENKTCVFRCCQNNPLVTSFIHADLYICVKYMCIHMSVH